MSTKKRKRGVVYKHAFDVRVTPHPDAEQGQLPLTKNDSIPMTIQTCDSSNTDPITEPLAQPVADQTLTTDDAPRVVQTDTAKNAVALSESIGLRLRAAREAKGLSCEAAAQSLKLPVAVVQALETERFERIGQAIYLRSYLSKYLQLLDLPKVLADRVVHEHAAPAPQLVTTGTVSRPRYLFDRYSGSALYLILTGVIVVPAVLLAMRAGFDQNLVRVSPLDASEVLAPIAKPQDEAPAVSTGSSPTEIAPTAASTAPVQANDTSAPLIASMTPFPASAGADTPAELASNPNQHTLSLHLAEASWVEIVAADGQKLEYGLLSAGSTHSYDSAKPLDVRIGNANGATLEINGKSKDLAPFRHSNVAHFKLSEGETTALHSGG